MPQPLGAPNLALPFPQYLYPTEIAPGVVPYDIGTNTIDLAAGDALPIPPGRWFVCPGRVSIVQYLDPITGVWRMHPWTASARLMGCVFQSDGVNLRVANLTGCPVSAVVTVAGSGYPTSGTVCTSGGSGGSTWLPIVGGAVSISSITAAGTGYGVPPLVFIPAPPAPGVPATADAAITSGTVSSITMRDWGAGYLTAPTITILPSPYDPNLVAGSAITNATALATLQGSGSVTAVLCTNPGNPVASTSVPALTITGTGGSSAAATALQLTTMTAGSVQAGGASVSAAIWQAQGTGVGATPNTQFPNPRIDMSTFIPRNAFGTFGGISGGSIASIGTIIDGGLFLGTGIAVAPLITQQSAVGGSVNLPSVSATLGSVQDTIFMQPAP